MYKIKNRFFTLALLVFMAMGSISCSGIFSGDDLIAPQSMTITQAYNNAVSDSMLKSDIYDKLTAIYSTNENLVWNADRSAIAVLSVMKPGREGTYSPVDKEITVLWKSFVTVLPELKTKVKSVPYANLNLRVEQALGLPDTGYNYCVELWVKPADLFRPSPDPEIDDTVSELTYRPGTAQDHINWLNQHIYESYYSTSKYPFTRLGYTYDWGGQTKYGPSEFVIKQGAVIKVKASAATISEYFK